MFESIKVQFSVIIPVHNKLPHIDRSIQSVLNQTYQEFELILIDDASTDGSSEKLKEYNDLRIRRFRRDTPGPGGYAARNLGIKKAKYDWIAFLDADDEWKLNYLSEIGLAIKKHKEINIFCAKWNTSSEGIVSERNELKVLTSPFYGFTLTQFFKNHSLMWTSAVVIKREILIESEGFPENRCKRGGDLDTWIRCLQYGKKGVFVNKPLAIYYRDTVNQVTDNKVNPTVSLCSFDSIKEIRKQTTDKELIKATDVFCAKFAYNHMIRTLKAKHVIDKSWLHTIQSRKLKCSILLKTYIYNFLLRLNVK